MHAEGFPISNPILHADDVRFYLLAGGQMVFFFSVFLCLGMLVFVFVDNIVPDFLILRFQKCCLKIIIFTNLVHFKSTVSYSLYIILLMHHLSMLSVTFSGAFWARRMLRTAQDPVGQSRVIHKGQDLNIYIVKVDIKLAPPNHVLYYGTMYLYRTVIEKRNIHNTAKSMT